MKTTTTVGTVIKARYGTIEVLAFEGAWRREVYTADDGKRYRESTMVANHRDVTPRHNKMDHYDSRCSCCYLNITHSEAKHAASL